MATATTAPPDDQLLADEPDEETPLEATQELVEEIHADAEVEAGVSEDNEYGELGRPFDRRHPFYLGFLATLGGTAAVAIAWTVVVAGQILTLLGLAFFIALGLEPVVVWLYRHHVPRWLAVIGVLLVMLGAVAGFLLAAVPVVVDQANALADAIPGYVHSANHHSTEIGRLDSKYHIVSGLQKVLHGQLSFKVAVGVGREVIDVAVSFVLVVVVSVYLLVDMPRVRHGLYRLAPRSRRPRMILLTDEMFSRVGGYVLGNLLTSVIAGVATWLWALAFGIPFALLLGVMVALLDLIPMIGSTVGGIIVSLVALTVSPGLAIATAAFYFLFRLLEDYLLTPRIMARTVSVPALVTIVATVIGGALLGIVGALLAIPVAASVKLLLDEILTPRLDEH